MTVRAAALRARYLPRCSLLRPIIDSIFACGTRAPHGIPQEAPRVAAALDFGTKRETLSARYRGGLQRTSCTEDQPLCLRRPVASRPGADIRVGTVQRSKRRTREVPRSARRSGSGLEPTFDSSLLGICLLTVRSRRTSKYGSRTGRRREVPGGPGLRRARRRLGKWPAVGYFRNARGAKESGIGQR